MISPDSYPEQPDGFLFRYLPGWVERYLVPLYRAAGHTWRVQIRGEENLREAEKSGSFIIATWHGQMTGSVYALRDRGYAGFVSPVYAGELIARVLSGMGFELIRGSSHFNTLSGMRGGIRLLNSGTPLCTIADGPEGPYRKCKPGAVLMAAVSGKPIVPIFSSCTSGISLPTWDRQVIPLPFAKVELRIGTPYFIEERPQKDELQVHLDNLEMRLGRLEKDTHWSLERNRGELYG